VQGIKLDEKVMKDCKNGELLERRSCNSADSIARPQDGKVSHVVVSIQRVCVTTSLHPA
jgi:hypothetical protein